MTHGLGLGNGNWMAEAAAGNAMLREEVTAQDIASVVSRWTGVPVDKMMAGEREKLLQMETIPVGNQCIYLTWVSLEQGKSSSC
mgnify:CR=1 FL=1